MPLTPEEIADITTASKNGGELPAHIKPLIDAGLVIRTPAQEAAFREHFKSTEIGNEIKKTHDLYDKDFKEVFGIEKNASEKSYDYFKRAANEWKQKHNTELEDLKTKVKTGTATEAEKQRITQLESMLVEKDKTYGERISGLTKELESKDVDYAINAALADIRPKLKKGIDESVLRDVIEKRLENVRGSAKLVEVEGKKNLVFLDKAGQPAISTTTYKPLTASDVLTEAFKDLLEEKREQGGAGSGGAGKAGAGVKPEDMVPGSDINTKMKLTQWLKDNGLTTAMPEYNKLFAKFSKDSNGKDLPIGM